MYINQILVVHFEKYSILHHNYAYFFLNKKMLPFFILKTLLGYISNQLNYKL